MSNKACSEFMEIIDGYWDDQVAFAEVMLCFYPEEWQRKVLMDLAQSPKVSVRSGQGVGRPVLESVVVIWFLCCRSNQKVICTAH
ncbi:terminase B, partial [Bacillus thuringiensis]|nr:terminase B [Bacillus thuringiensis]